MPDYNPASEFGFSPNATAAHNVKALQKALDRGGTIRIDHPGVYNLNATVKIGSDTALEFGEGVYLRREGNYSYTIVNKGAFTHTFDHNIKITGLKLICNKVDISGEIPGLNAQLAFFYVKNLIVRELQCLDLPAQGFCLQVCTFEHILLEHLHIEGMKDAVHLGGGRKFVIRHGLFRTYDDPIALNAYDYSGSNPQFGWIEDGIIEDCYDLDQESTTGFFCRMLAGSWLEWTHGMEVRHSDLVASNGRLYSVNTQPDGVIYVSLTPPTHTDGNATLDGGIIWRMVQDDYTRNCAIKNVHFKNIFLKKKRDSAFCMLLELNQYARSIYPGARMPVIQDIILENILFGNEIPFLLSSNAACRTLKIINSVLDHSSIALTIYPEMAGKYPDMTVLFSGTTFRGQEYEICRCDPGRRASLNVLGSIVEDSDARLSVSGDVRIIASDIELSRLSNG